MSKAKQPVTLEELKTLVRARFRVKQVEEAEHEAWLRQQFDREPPEAMHPTALIKEKLFDQISDVIARRLKRNRRSTPLVSSRDLVRLVPGIIEELEMAYHGKLDTKLRAVLEQATKTAFKGIAEMTNTTVVSDRNPYEEYWRWVRTVLDLAAERRMPPTELLECEEVRDEITRRLYTKEQFVDYHKWVLEKFLNFDTFKESVLPSVFEAIATKVSKEEFEEMKGAIEAEFMPQMRAAFEQTVDLFSCRIGMVISRIYGAN